MSVVILDVEDRAIYSDTNLSQGTTDMCQIRKSKYLEIGKYKVLMGGIGVPSVVEMLMAFAVKDIELIPEQVEIGEYPSFIPLSTNHEMFANRINAFAHIQGNDDLNSDLFIAVEDTDTGAFHVGMMITHNPIITWGLTPPIGDNTICLGANQVVSAWRTTNGTTLGRIAQLCKTIQFLKFPNSIERISIDGIRTQIEVGVDEQLIRKFK